MLTPEVKKYIHQSILCWLATVDENGQPNVSPKEIFTHFGESHLIIANIASPNSLKNIRSNPKIGVSFIDVLVQKGFQIKGEATIIEKSNIEYEELSQPLLEMTGGKFPFYSIFKIRIEKIKPILAPSYIFYPESTEQEQIEKAKKAYRL